jgi:EmrB/QacA subfamily drug resistance transporter
MTQNSSAGTNKNSVLIIAALVLFMVPFLVSSINIALPEMNAQFHMEAVVMTWVNTIYFLAIAVAQVPMGRLADISGRKKVFIAGLVIFFLTAIAGACATSAAVLLIIRAFQGFGAGMMFNTIIAILTSVFPSDERGKALGISMVGTYSGLLCGPLIGGFMTRQFGWPSIFILCACLNLLLLALALLTIKGEWREARNERFDIPGTLIYVASMAMFIYGFSSLPQVAGIIFTVVGMAGLYFFIGWELKASSPLLDFRLFKNNRVFVYSNIATLINYLASFSVTYLLSLYLQYIKELKPDEAGIVLIFSSIPMAVFTPLAGRISDKIEPRLVAATGMALCCVALALMIFLNNTTPIWYIIIALVIYGTGMGISSSPNTNAIMGSVESKILGVASGTVGTMRTIGMMLSMGIIMIIFTLYIGKAEITAEYYPQFLASNRAGFIVFTVLGIGGVIAQLAARGKAR